MNRYAVVDVLDRLGIEVLSEKDDELVAHCPGHETRTGKADNKPSWSINADSGEHHCFSCGYGGTLAGLVAGTQNLRRKGKPDLDKAQSWLEEFNTGSLEVLDRLVLVPPRHSGPKVLPEHELQRFVQPPDWALGERGLAAVAARRFGVLWEPRREAWIAPIRDPLSHALWGWQMKGQRTKVFRNLPPGVPKADAVFGLDQFKGGTAVLVESPLDCLRLWTAGVHGGVASFGATVHPRQIQRILERSDGLVVALDNPYTDDAGRKASLEILRDHGVKGIHFFRYTPDSPKDIGDMTDNEIYDGLDHALHSVWGRKAVLA